MTIVTSNATTGNTALLNLPMGSFVYYVSGSFVDKDGNQVIPSISSQGSDGTFTISLDEDRNGDSGVASDFVKTCGGTEHVFSPFADSGTSSPGDLNFYFGLDISFGGPTSSIASAVTRIYLAQGKQSGHDNWWMGCATLNQTGLSYNQAHIVIANIYDSCTNVTQTTYLAGQLAGGGDVNQYKIALSGFTVSA